MDLDQQYIWITTRRLKPGTRKEFSQAWRPSAFPEGMLRAYECDAVGSFVEVNTTIFHQSLGRP